MSLERFNQLYGELVAQLGGMIKGGLSTDYSSYGPNDYIKDFVKYNLPYIDDIASRNVEVFQTRSKGAFLVKGVKVGKFLAKVRREVVDAVFDYLRDLYLEGAEHFENFVTKLPADSLIQERAQAVANREALVALFRGEEVPVEDVEVELSEDEEEEGSSLPFDPQTLFDQIQDSEIGKVARDICDGLGDTEKEQFENLASEGMQNPSDLFTRLFSEMSSGGEGLGGLVKKTMDTVQQKIESGEIDMERMMQDAQKFVGSLGGLGGMPPGMFPPGFPPGPAGGPKKRRGK